MIKRAVYDTIIETASSKPVTLITGARQVGKTTLCAMIGKELGIPYVTLADFNERKLAENDPEMFVKVHGYPLIIDEVQYAPGLFDVIESVVDRERLDDPECCGLFVLTGSQAYRMMEGVSQSMSGRVGMVEVSPISLSEEYGFDEMQFTIDPEKAIERCGSVCDDTDMYHRIFRGMYPEVVAKRPMSVRRFYADYVETYIMRDVSEIVNVRNKQKFRSFMEVVASLTGQELVYETICKSAGVDRKTVDSWLSVLEAGGIIRTLQPYSDKSVVKRVAKRPKIYMRDTGLACYLSGIPDERMLMSSYLKGPMAETFIVNEIIKTHDNKGLETPFFHYRDSNNNEVDLVMLYDGKLNMVECKSGIGYDRSDVNAFGRLATSLDRCGCLVCYADTPYPIADDVYAIPVRSIGY